MSVFPTPMLMSSPIPGNNAWKQMLINTFAVNPANIFNDTAGNPFAAIYDPSVAALGSLTSLADSGRGVNTAVEATNPPVNTAAAMGAANGLLFNGTTSLLTGGTNTSVDEIFAAGGTFFGVIKPTTIGEGSAGRIFDKNATLAYINDASGSNCVLGFIKNFSVTNGSWVTASRDITLGAVNIIAITYNSSSTSNSPTIYVNSLTPKALTQLLTPTLTPNTDAAANLILGNNSTATRTTDGYLGKMFFAKSVITLAQLTAMFNFCAVEYSVTLT